MFLRIDDEGIHLGGRHPRRINWPDIADVVNFTREYCEDPDYLEFRSYAAVAAQARV